MTKLSRWSEDIKFSFCEYLARGFASEINVKWIRSTVSVSMLAVLVNANVEWKDCAVAFAQLSTFQNAVKSFFFLSITHAQPRGCDRNFSLSREAFFSCLFESSLTLNGRRNFLLLLFACRNVTTRRGDKTERFEWVKRLVGEVKNVEILQGFWVKNYVETETVETWLRKQRWKRRKLVKNLHNVMQRCFCQKILEHCILLSFIISLT